MKLVRVKLGQGRSIGLCGIPACAESAKLTDLACNGHSSSGCRPESSRPKHAVERILLRHNSDDLLHII